MTSTSWDLSERLPWNAGIVVELCRWKTPHRDAPDQEAGQAALDDLRRTDEDDEVLVDPARAAIEQRRQKAEQERREREKQAHS